VQRFGIGDGFIFAGQDNYWQAVKGGGNGDYHLITLAPNSVQECHDMAYESFEIAEKWMHPVLLLSDGTIGQMVEPCELKPMQEYDMDQPWATKGVQPGEEHKVITDITYFQDLDEWNEEYLQKMRKISETEQRWENICVEDADIVLVAYGISSRVAESAVARAREEGFKLGLIRPITLWPYPRKAFEEIPDTCRGVVTVEVNMMGQMRDDVIITVKGKFPTYAYATRRSVAKVDEIIAYAKDVFDGKVKEEEVY
jgi:pyruvate/2-oxoacid:ferredoxin oxidoreductase alpha subunit